MVTVIPIPVGDQTAIGIEVKLPKTNLVAVTTDKGYIMCGALDIGLLNERLGDRNILAARAVGVRNFAELLAAPMESVTHEAAKLGIHPGMSGTDALLLMF